MTIDIRSRAGQPIRSLEDWKRVGGTAGPGRWRPGRCAYELAAHWTSGEGETAIAGPLETAQDLTGFAPHSAVVAGRTRFDAFGGPRDFDLLVRGDAPAGTVVVAIEAKVGDGYGESVSEHRAANLEDRGSGKDLESPERLENLLTSIFGASLDDRPELGDLRFQLVSAAAGTLVECHNTAAGVLMLQDFGEPGNDADDLRAFLKLGFDAELPDGDSWCVGPFRVPGSDLIPADRDFYVAKTTTELAPAAEYDDSPRRRYR